MKASKLVETAIKIANEPTVYYSVSGGSWCKWNGSSWNMDCVCMIKGILWGFNFDKSASHGGAIYGSNGVYDDDADGIMKRCTSVSTDFNNIKVGEIVHMGGHVGVYIGNRQVVESTAWFGKTIISNIGNNGERTKDGAYGGKWINHGTLQYVEYDKEPTPSFKDVNVYYRVKTTAHGWLPEVRNLEDYAGWENSPITDIAIRVDKGSIKYRVAPLNSDFLPYVTGYDINDSNNGYAGIGKAIDRVEVYYYTPEDIRPYKRAKYKVNNFDWQYDNETGNGQDGFAGAKGIIATKFQITIE